MGTFNEPSGDFLGFPIDGKRNYETKVGSKLASIEGLVADSIEQNVSAFLSQRTQIQLKMYRRRWDSNPQSSDPKSDAIAISPRRLLKISDQPRVLFAGWRRGKASDQQINRVDR